jgi:hypothetical protein
MERKLPIIPALEWAGYSHVEKARLLQEGFMPQMAGADDGPEDPPADPPADPPLPGDVPPSDPPADPPAPKAKNPDGTVTISQSQWDALNRDVAETRRRERKLAEESRKADERAKQEQGRFKELWEAEKTRAEQLQARHEERDRFEAENARRDRVTKRARGLYFHDPEDAFALLRTQPGVTESTLDDDALVDHALNKLAENKRYLVGKTPRSNGDINPGSTNADDIPAGRDRIRHVRRVAG